MMGGDICGGLQYSKVIALGEWHSRMILSFDNTELLWFIETGRALETGIERKGHKCGSLIKVETEEGKKFQV
jgi:hypothetical protein